MEVILTTGKSSIWIIIRLFYFNSQTKISSGLIFAFWIYLDVYLEKLIYINQPNIQIWIWFSPELNYKYQEMATALFYKCIWTTIEPRLYPSTQPHCWSPE